jgi:hypothetical protein
MEVLVSAGLIAAAMAVGAVVWDRRRRREEKRLSHRRKKKIDLFADPGEAESKPSEPTSN